mgnify:CR=1 FL=1
MFLQLLLELVVVVVQSLYQEVHEFLCFVLANQPLDPQELLQLQFEERKKHSKQQSSLQKQLLKQEKFERKQQKRREKHKGH